MLLYGTCVSGFYRFKAVLLTVTTVKAHHVFALEVLCQNRSHKLTACFIVYCKVHILGQELRCLYIFYFLRKPYIDNTRDDKN